MAIETSKRSWMDYFRLSKWEYYAEFFITMPVTLALLGLSLFKDLSWLWPLFFTAGAVTWTLYEYLMHRWILHHWWFARDLHQLHHDAQRDYIATHPAVTVVAYILLWLVFGFNGSAFFAGFSTAYVVYSVLHTMFHYATIRPGHWLHGLKRHHATHHVFGNVDFGVTTKFWDRLFGTCR